MRLLLFAGAGSSVELGVPAMRTMAEQFRDHLRDTGVSADVVSTLDRRLEERCFDIENVIDELDTLVGAEEVAQKWGVNRDPEHGLLGTVRDEAEWFVQNACERVNPTKARQMWVPTLRALKGHEVCIATTNYDRAIEIAGAELGIRIGDGFGSLGEGGHAKWTGFLDENQVKLLKLHGSTDWYRTEAGQLIYKLRHPMALFGPVTINLRDLTLGHAIVLPSREKRTTGEPYQIIAYELRKWAERAEAAVFLGTSLRDPPIRGVCNEAAGRVPTFVVTRNPQVMADSLDPAAIRIAQCASRFLASSLPRALDSPDVSGFVQSLKTEPEATEGILDALMTARDKTRPWKPRCAAIDRLAASRAALDAPFIEHLLRDEQTEVRIYALALIQESTKREELLLLAKALAEKDGETDFATETRLLDELMGSPDGRP